MVILLQSQMWMPVLRLDLAPSAGLMDQENKQQAVKSCGIKCVTRVVAYKSIFWYVRIL